jgi:uncharacterized protein (TIGR00251 family)
VTANKAGSDSLTANLPIWLSRATSFWLLALHIQPGARCTSVVGKHGNRLKIAIAAPAQDGRANVVLLRFLATQLRVPLRSLQLKSGAASRIKRVSLDVDSGLEAGDFAARLFVAHK